MQSRPLERPVLLGSSYFWLWHHFSFTEADLAGFKGLCIFFYLSHLSGMHFALFLSSFGLYSHCFNPSLIVITYCVGLEINWVKRCRLFSAVTSNTLVFYHLFQRSNLVYIVDDVFVIHLQSQIPFTHTKRYSVQRLYTSHWRHTSSKMKIPSFTFTPVPYFIMKQNA